MKRDWDLIRRLLIETEKLKPKEYLMPQAIADENPVKVGYHFMIMIEAKLIHGTDNCNDYSRLETCFAMGISWEGHEFLDSIRRDSMWNKIKSTAVEKSSALSFEAIKAAITLIIKQAV